MMAGSQSPARLFLLLAALLAVGCAQKSPQFIYSQSNKIMLSWDDVWQVGVSNKLAFLNKDKRLIVRIKVVGDTGGNSGNKILVYKCTESSSPQEVALNNVQSESQYCSGTMPFTLSKVSGKEGIEFYFTLLDSMQTYDTVFSQKIQLYVRVEFPVGSIMSNSLFVYNLDAISKSELSGVTPEAVIDNYYKRFLTVPGINFMLQMNTTNDAFSNVTFIDQKIISQIKNAPDFIKAKMNIGAVLQFDAGDCQNFQSHLVSMFVNYYSKMNENNIKLLKHIGLSLDDGKLYYSKYGLTTTISNFFTDRSSPKEIGICTLVSFAGHSQPYFKVDEVKQKIPTKNIVNYKQMGSRTPDCSIVGSGVSRSVNIFAGMDYTPLVCPIICDDPNELFRFYHGNQQLVPSGQSEWTNIQGLRISRAGNLLEFPPELFENDSGEYRCEAGTQKFRFNVKIVSMPQFLTTLHDNEGKTVSGDLPQVVYAMENETLSYTCTVYYTNMDRVSVVPNFHTIGTADQKWKELNLAQFNQQFSPSDSIVSQSVIAKNETQTLNLTIARVPFSDSSTYLNFTHRFVCNAFVSTADAKKVGLPSYSVQSSSNVIFLKRPTIRSFNRTSAKDCSVQMQKCSNKYGGTFEVSLNPELTQRLEASGVKVSAHFKIDNELLENIHTIHGKDISELKFYPETNRLLFKILPNTKKEVIGILQKYKTITPVFNFGYQDSADARLTNLRLHKERYGQPIVSFGDRDCRADSACFYSTDFDSAGSLADLTIGLGFKWIGDPVAEPASASAGLIAGITLVALIVIIAIILLVLLLRRDPGKTYMVDERERQQGNHPDLEAKEEHFKEYQPAEGAPMQARRLSVDSYSVASIKSQDDHELDDYKDDMGDMGDFTEDGSFIGEYRSKDKKRGEPKKK